MITVENLFFDYPGKRALDDVSFTIQPNTITALVGPNGAGKTTLLRCLAALSEFTSGNITIDNWNVEEHPRKIHQMCSYLSDFFGLYDELTVSQSLTYMAWAQGCKNKQVEEKVRIATERLKLKDYINTKAGALSRGLRQRLAIAQVIIQEPKILFLDEPASGLDPEARHDLSQLLLELKSHDMTIVVSSHILSELEDYSTDMLVIREGKIVEQCSLEKDQNKPSVYKITLEKSAKQYQQIVSNIEGVEWQGANGNIAMVTLNNLTPQVLLKTLVQLEIPVQELVESQPKMQDVYLNLAQKEKGEASDTQS